MNNLRKKPMLLFIRSTVFLIWMFFSLVSITVFMSVWALQTTFKVAKLSTEITSNTIKHKKAIKNAVLRVKAKARLKRMITMLPFAGAAAGIYFEESEFQEWLLENPTGSRSEYLCEIAEITSEILDEVINDLPQTIKPSGSLLKNITPKCIE